ncbi:hypothetical protein BH24ACT21_BH24ACT21_14040 [soil metagenome]
MVFGIFGGLLMPITAAVDFGSGNFGAGVFALVMTIVTFAVCATTPGRPGYSAIAYVVIFVAVAVAGSVALVAGMLLLVAALLGGIAAFFMRRSARVT